MIEDLQVSKPVAPALGPPHRSLEDQIGPHAVGAIDQERQVAGVVAGSVDRLDLRPPLAIRSPVASVLSDRVEDSPGPSAHAPARAATQLALRTSPGPARWSAW